MIYMVFFVVCFLASIIGAICGIGGGVIIKPVLDAFGVLDVASISFLSGCTVLSMTTYSVLAGKARDSSSVNRRTGMPLALGAAVGGMAGKWMFSVVSALSPDKNKVGAIQAACLTVITVGTLIYTIYKDRIRTWKIENAACCALIGIVLGVMSSFLGIGGGPINLIVLFYFFSMPTKTAAENSLYIIFFSQLTSLISSLVTGSVPDIQISVLVLMVLGGIGGGICGRAWNRKLNDKLVDKLFMVLMVLIIFINIYNVYKFMG
ncbi:MAG: sulfite exporter TauE/SafE family protein [Clostridiales bacterium]|nr:sulfite exporter TauE/SafE family protein [Clostridiales bacterium]